VATGRGKANVKVCSAASDVICGAASPPLADLWTAETKRICISLLAGIKCPTRVSPSRGHSSKTEGTVVVRPNDMSPGPGVLAPNPGSSGRLRN
jgi:hypothetical protein